MARNKEYSPLLYTIMEEYQIARFTEQYYIFEDGSRKKRQGFRDEVFPKDMGNLSKNFYKLDPRFYDTLDDKSPEARKKIKLRFFEDLEEIVRKSSSYTGNINSAPEDCGIVTTRADFSNYRLFKHITGDRYKGGEVLYDIVKGRISKISPETYMESLNADEKSSFKPLLAVFEYDPQNITPVKPITFEGQQFNRVNTYTPPDWRRLDVEYSKTMPPLFSLFIKHLFPDVESRRFVLSWMRNVILTKAETVLILNGAKGTGKNIFADFLKELVGAENFGRAKTSLIKKEFNSMLEDKRLIFFDEIKIDKKGHTFLKDACNNEHNIEKKGKDANNLTPTYYSILACNNDSSDVYLEPDDRRFSTPNITDKTLKGEFTEEEISQLIALQKNPLAIKEIGEFIINYEHDTYSYEFHAFKPEKFYALVASSLYGWKQIIMEELGSYSRPINIAHLREDARESGVMFPSTSNKIENFLKNYHHRGMFRVGYVEKDEKKYLLYISKEYKDFLALNSVNEEDI